MKINNYTISLLNKERNVQYILGEPEGVHRKKLIKILKYGDYQITLYRDSVIRIVRYDDENDIIEFEDQSGHFIRVFDPKEDR